MNYSPFGVTRKKATIKDVFIGSLFLTMIGGTVGGYVMNFQNLVQYNYPSKEFILSLAGVFFAPLGAVTGWIW